MTRQTASPSLHTDVETINSAETRAWHYGNVSSRERRDSSWETLGLILMRRRLIYAAEPFRTATLKTLTAFNFRWPSILFSLVWTTSSRTGYPATPSACSSRLRQGNYLSSPSLVPDPPVLLSRPFCPLLPFLYLSPRLPPPRSQSDRESRWLSLRAVCLYTLRDSISLAFSWIMFEKEHPLFPPANEFESLRLQRTDTRFRYPIWL